MVFSILASLIMFGVVCCLLISFPKGKNRRKSFDSADADLEIYQMQLKEIDRDSARGLIDNESAEEARLEIARSILKLNKTKKNNKDNQQSFMNRFILTLGIILISVIALIVYIPLGKPDLPEQPFYLLMEKDPKDLAPQENLARLEVLALRNPLDTKTIEELASSYLMAGRYKDAANRFNNAIALNGENAKRLTGLGMALVGDEDGIVGENAQKLFEKAVALDENQYFAQILLARENIQNSRPDLALERLTNLYNRMPADAPERQELKQNIDALSASINGNHTEQLLEQLYDKLKADPSKIDGWKLLIKTWIDLGDKQKATAILQDAISKSSPENALELKAFAHENDLDLTKGETNNE